MFSVQGPNDQVNKVNTYTQIQNSLKYGYRQIKKEYKWNSIDKGNVADHS